MVTECLNQNRQEIESRMAHAPGKAFRKEPAIMDLKEMFPTEESAREWFEGIFWPDGRK